MSGPDRIYASATALTQSPADALAADPSALTWLCPVCGKLRVFEGGRPLGSGHHDECEECGCALFSAQSHASPIRTSNLAW